MTKNLFKSQFIIVSVNIYFNLSNKMLELKSYNRSVPGLH